MGGDECSVGGRRVIGLFMPRYLSSRVGPSGRAPLKPAHPSPSQSPWMLDHHWVVVTSGGAPVAAALEAAAVAASLGAAYKHGEDGDMLDMGTSLVGAVPGLGAFAGKGVRLVTRVVEEESGTLVRATGSAARALGGRINASALPIPASDLVRRFSSADFRGQLASGDASLRRSSNGPIWRSSCVPATR